MLGASPFFAPVAAGALDELVIEPEVAAAELILDVALGTELAMSVPHVVQASEPGFCWRHWAKVAWQMWLGRVSRYWSMEAGAEPLEQMHW